MDAREVIDFEDKNGFSVNKSQKECYIKAVNYASIQEKILNAKKPRTVFAHMCLLRSPPAFLCRTGVFECSA
jgi:hypothetical protein